MNIQNLIIYQFITLYEILKELENNLNLEVIDMYDEKSLKEKINNSDKYLIVTKKKNLKFR